MDNKADFVERVLNYAEERNVGWLGWAWYPWNEKSSSSLISDWRGTPTPMGRLMRERMLRLRKQPQKQRRLLTE